MDYDALASKFGGKDSDYDTIAAKFGGTDVEKMNPEMTWAEKNIAPLLEKIGIGALPSPRPYLMGGADAPVGAAQLAANALPFGAGIADKVNKFVAQKEAEYQRTRNPEETDWGRMAGNVFGPASLGAMKAIPFLAGGAGIGSKAAAYAGNVAIGAGAGAGMNVLQPVSSPDYWDKQGENALHGAGAGAFGAAVIAPLISAAAKGSGWAYDALRGRLGDLKAAQIMRDVAGDEYGNIQKAWANAPENLTASQAMYGKADSDVMHALGDVAKQHDKSGYYRRLADAQEEALRAPIAVNAGGETQTASREAARANKEVLSKEIFTPRMERDLAAANEGAKAVAARQRAQALDEAAASKVQDVRRLTEASGRAEDMGTAFGRRTPATEAGAPTGNPSAGKAYSYGQELAGRAESEASKAAADSLILGEGRRFSQSIADAIEKRGMKPMDVNPILAGLQRKLNDPSSAGNKKYEAVINRVAQDMREWADKNGGIIDSRAAYAIRKNSVNDAVEDLTKGLDPKSSAKYAAQVLSDVRPMIDDAIVAAGGKNWPTTLKIFESGMKQIDRQKMSASALDLFDKSKNKFVDLVRGNDPKRVEKVFGANRDNIETQMGGKYRALDKAATAVERDKDIERIAESARGGLADILQKDAIRFKAPGFLNPKVTVFNKALERMETSINRDSMEKIVDAMKTGQSAKKLLEMVPTSQRSRFLEILQEEADKAVIAAPSTQEKGK